MKNKDRFLAWNCFMLWFLIYPITWIAHTFWGTREHFSLKDYFDLLEELYKRK